MTAGPRDGTLLQLSAGGRVWTFDGSRPVVVGRDQRCDVLLPDQQVSRVHLGLRRDERGWVVEDLGSSNGTAVDGTVLPAGRPDGAPGTGRPLEPGWEHRVRLGLQGGPELLVRWAPVTPGPVPGPGPAAGPVVVIGRDPSCDVVVAEDPLVSRRHAAVRVTGPGAAVLEDLGSSNGTHLNGVRLTGPAPLGPGDTIGVGGTMATWDGRAVLLPRAGGRRTATLSARHLGVSTRSGKRLLDDVTLTARAGQLVAVIGPSGAGKSTLLGALTGLRPAGMGRVTWDGRDLYAEYDHLRHQIGLVPQDDVLHRQLTVRRALDYAARLRLPQDTTAAERDQRVRQVLAEVGLSAQLDQRIDSLSGGQRKRTSIALELLTAPQLLFLDEPTSGLDPGLDRQVMEGLRSLADDGRVVLVVTHSVLALDQCDLVLLLATGGRVAFFGPPQQLLSFFGVPDHASVFRVIDDPVWVSRFAESPVRQAYVGSTSIVTPTPPPAGRAPAPMRPAPVRQLVTLVRRNLAVVAADRLFLALLVGMPVVLAVMAHAFPGEAGLSLQAAGGDPAEAQQRIIVLVVGAALMGAALAVREFVAERPIYRREHAVGLSPTAYLAGKVLVLGGAVALQSVAFTLLALIGLPGPDDPRVLPWGHGEVALAAAGVGVTMSIAALAVSALARSTDQTMPALVALVMGQLVLCGGLFPLADRAGLEQVSWLLPARAGYAAMAATAELQPLSGPQPDPLFTPTAERWALDLGLLALQAAVFLALTAWALARSVARSGTAR
ncbi:FHA domain-containing protein [Geodermatophilus tzadiensis]|uniref:FHA domain-containing protein n=1 Tax=Geodermatophilus tzadiensis TaxID=1137988 RepID=UPI0014752FE7|nr:FHA domain-containing protein [Geodermatophilus tzadiensis]